MNRAGAKQRVMKEAELLGMLLSEHPENGVAGPASSAAVDYLRDKITTLSNAFPEDILRAHTYFETERPMTTTIKNGGAFLHSAHTGGVIKCRLAFDPEREFVGTAVCMDTDAFDGDFGRRLALFRARTAAAYAKKKDEFNRKAKQVRSERRKNKVSAFFKTVKNEIASSFFAQHHP